MRTYRGPLGALRADDGIDDDGGYGGDFPGGILGTIMEGDSSDDDGGCMSARYNAAGTDETVAVTGNGSGRGGSRQGSGRKSVASGGSRNGEHSSKRPRARLRRLLVTSSSDWWSSKSSFWRP